MTIGPGRAVAAAALIVLSAALSQCSSKPGAPPDATKTAPQASSTNAALLGDMTPVVSVRELMKFMIDPIADNIFDAVWTDITPKGNIEHRPRTDADWEKVRVGAVTIAEGIYLLKVPRPFTPPGDVNNSTGPNPPELSPTQIKAKLDADPVLWNAKIEALRNVALEVIDIVKKRDVDELFDAGEDLDKACESCHLEYWYPGDRAAVDDAAQQKARVEKGGAREKKQ